MDCRKIERGRAGPGVMATNYLPKFRPAILTLKRVETASLD
jgi:hypothetical protein